MKIDIYIYWMGGKKPPIDIDYENRRFKNLNFILGPSEAEHEFLMESVWYYRKSFEEGTFAFCSDVWRVYVLSKANGVYIDASTTIGRGFEEWIKKLYSYKYVFIKEAADYLTNAFFLGNDHVFFEEMFKMYASLEYGSVSTKALFEGPTLLTLKFNEYFQLEIKDFKEQKNGKDILLLNYLDFLNENVVYNYGGGSWANGGRETANGFRKNNARLWTSEKKQEKYLSGKRFETGKELMNPFDVWRLRTVYDNSSDKRELQIIDSLYRKIEHVTFFEKMFWSKLYRAFRFKKTNY